jgi:lipopolysaccharide export system permease protein
LVGKGLSTSVIAELLFYASFTLIPMALPLAVLLASLMTFGNLGENNELLAFKSAGVSLQRIMFPLIVLTIFICVGAFYFSNIVLPFSNLKMTTLLIDVQNKRPELQIKPGRFSNSIDGYSILINDKDVKTNLMKEIKIYDHSERKGNIKITTADSGYMKMTSDEKALIVTLYNGYNYYEVPQQAGKRQHYQELTYPHRRDKFDEQVIVLTLKGFGLKRSDENLFRSHYQMLNLKQLAYAKDSLNIELAEERDIFYTNLLQSEFRTRSTPKNRTQNQEENGATALTRYNERIIQGIDEEDEPFYESHFGASDTSASTGSYSKGGLHGNKIKVRDLDSLFNTFNTKQKSASLGNAVSLATAAKNYIASTSAGITNKERRIIRHEIEWHRKFTLSFACFIFFFIGAPLGAIIRKGGLGMPVVISVFFFVVYYVISISGEKMARENIIPVEEGMWISSFILLPLGIFLTYKATSDSAILNIDTYFKFLKKARDYINKVFPFTSFNSNEDTTSNQ